VCHATDSAAKELISTKLNLEWVHPSQIILSVYTPKPHFIDCKKAYWKKLKTESVVDVQVYRKHSEKYCFYICLAKMASTTPWAIGW
jgi:hypothetical protein